MSDTLVAFLLARIAEDEAVAHTAAIGSESWRLDDLNETVCWWPPERESVIAFEREHGLPLSDGWSGQTIESAGEQIAPHIARHDPARVLAECEAKRRIVDKISGYLRSHISDDFSGERLGEDVLDLLALPFADHPDFRPEWAPQG